MILERLKQYIDAKGITIAAFEREAGMSNAAFGKALKNNGAIGTDKLENILSTYPDINPCLLYTSADEIDIALQIDPELIEPIVTIRVSRLECNRTENIPLIGMELIEFVV